MRFFSLLDFQYTVLAYFFGFVSSILVYLAWGSYPARRHAVSSEDLKKLEGHEIAGGHKTEDNPVAPFLVFIYAAVIIWAIAYVIVIGFKGGPIG